MDMMPSDFSRSRIFGQAFCGKYIRKQNTHLWEVCQAHSANPHKRSSLPIPGQPRQTTVQFGPLIPSFYREGLYPPPSLRKDRGVAGYSMSHRVFREAEPRARRR